MKAVAILGAGPAGLMAAHAAALAGQPVAILSEGSKSKLGGAQFLHEPIPELTDKEPDILITYRVAGNAVNYQRKAYGSGPQPSFVSFDGVSDGMQQPGWNLRKMYDRLWETYGGQITQMEITGRTLPGILEDSLFSMVISSIPLRSLCRRPAAQHQGGHLFRHQSIVIKLNECFGGPDENTIWYDGSQHHSWYRASSLWGVRSTEWGLGIAGTVPYDLGPQVQAFKPVDHQCDCWPDLIKVGRFGRWQKGMLAHDGFRTAIQELHSAGLLQLPERIRP